MAKVIFAMETGTIAANLHYEYPNPDVPGLIEGRLKVVNKHTPLDIGKYVGVSGFGIGGSNAHVIVKANPKKKFKGKLESKLLRLVTACGRTHEAVEHFLTSVQDINEDEHEFLALLNCISNQVTKTMPFRGYMILDS